MVEPHPTQVLDVSAFVPGYVYKHTLKNSKILKIFEAEYEQTSQQVAIKVVQLGNYPLSRLQLLERDISSIKLLSHQNIVHIFSFIPSIEFHQLSIIQEFTSGGSLESRISSLGRFTHEQARDCFMQLITSIDYCHKNNIIHGLINPECILFDSQGQLKVSDLGFSFLLEENSFEPENYFSLSFGPKDFDPLDCIAPEVLMSRSINKIDGKYADIWSCGIILFYMLSGSSPFEKRYEIRKNFNVETNYWNINYPSYFSQAVERLLGQIFHANPEARASINQISLHEWIICPGNMLPNSHINPYTPFNSLTSLTQESMNGGINFEDSRLTVDKLLHQPELNFNFNFSQTKNTFNDRTSHSSTVFQNLLNEQNVMDSLAGWATDIQDNNQTDNI